MKSLGCAKIFLVFIEESDPQPGLRKTRFFKKKQDFILFFKENGKTLFFIVFISSCNIIIFRITE